MTEAATSFPTPVGMFLSATEVDEICAGYTRTADKRRHLRSLGLIVNETPSGWPLVVRSHAEAVLSGLAQVAAAEAITKEPSHKPAPNKGALMQLFARKAA